MCRTFMRTSTSLRNCWKKSRDSFLPYVIAESRPGGRLSLLSGKASAEVFDMFVENVVEKRRCECVSDSEC